METITNISKVIEKLNDKTIHKLIIKTVKKDGRKWMAYIAISVPNSLFGGFSIMPNFICEFYFNDIQLEEKDFLSLIGRTIIKKEHCQIDEHTKGTPKFSKSHMTKLSIYLDKDDILNMKIAEVYDTRIDNYYQHTGGDQFFD